MALFGKKPLSLEDIKKAIDGLKDEEKEQLVEHLSVKEAKVEVDDTAEETVVEETGDETVVDETVVEETVDETQDEVVGDDTKNEAVEALTARLTKLEEQYADLLKKFEVVADVKADDDFGAKGETPDESLDDERSNDERIMRNYYKR